MQKSKHFTRKELLQIIAPLGLGLVFYGCNEAAPKEIRELGKGEEKDTLGQVAEVLGQSGCVFVFPENKQFKGLNQPFNLRVPKTPKCIALCSSAVGIQNAIIYAKDQNLKVGIKSGGHSFENYSTLEDGLTINLSLFKSIEVNGDEATIESGCLLREVNDALISKGKILPAGSCGSVGIGGLTLGGGYGFFSRKYGLTCDHLIEAKMITAKGEQLIVNKDHELFKVLKGAGNGNFGVVYEFKFKIHPAPKLFRRWKLKSYKMTLERYKALLPEWIKLTQSLPESVFAAFVQNKKTAVFLITDFEQADLQGMIDRFAILCDKTYPMTQVPLAKALTYYYGVQESIPFKNSSAGYFNSYEDFEPFINQVIPIVLESKGLIYQINTLGGAIGNAVFREDSIYPHRDYALLTELQAYWEESEVGKELVQQNSKILTIIEEAGVSAQYVNYPSAEFKSPLEKYYGKENIPQLMALKKAYDESNLFARPQGLSNEEENKV